MRRNLQRKLTIGFAAIADFRNTMGNEYMRGVLDAVDDFSLSCVNLSGAIRYSDTKDMYFYRFYREKLRFINKSFLDGLILWDSSFNWYLKNAEIEQLIRSFAPLPVIGLGYNDVPGMTSVRIDDRAAMTLLFDHLVNQHHYTRFAFLGWKKQSIAHTLRLQQYQAEIAQRKLPVLEDSVFQLEDGESATIVACVERLCRAHSLRNHGAFDALIIPSDEMAALVIRELHYHGIDVPRDIAIVGFNNQLASLSSIPTITTVDLCSYRRAYLAVQMLMEHLLDGTKLPPVVYIQPELVIRQSCGCFESEILEAGLPCPAHTLQEDESAVLWLCSQLAATEILPDRETALSLSEVLISDLVSNAPQNAATVMVPRTLVWFQSFLQQTRAEEDAVFQLHFQQLLTVARGSVHALFSDKPDMLAVAERLFHQLRLYIAMVVHHTVGRQSNEYYMLGSFADAAIDIVGRDAGSLKSLVSQLLNRLQIPGALIVLLPQESETLDPGELSLILPEPENAVPPCMVRSPEFFPKKYLDMQGANSFMIEILHEKNLFLGYAFFSMYSRNVAMYDTAGTLLSHLLHRYYQKTGRTAVSVPMLTSGRISELLHISQKGAVGHPLNATSLVEYLVAHIDCMTDVERIASDLSVSVSTLERISRRQTGFTVQKLHEKIKIEQAKQLLQIKSLKLENIARRLGFQNQYYFSTVFKRNTGKSPRNYTPQEP